MASRAKRRLADAITQTAAQSPIRVLNVTVKSVSAGTSLDGVAEVTVTLGGSDQRVPYLDSYLNPAVGDSVRVEIFQGSPIITGRVVGLPNI